MTAIAYANFDLLIAAAGAGYEARVLDSPGGQAKAVFDLPYTREQLDELIQQLSGTPADEKVAEAAATFGRRLFEAVFSGEVRDGLAQSLSQADGDHGLRLRLRLSDVPELARLPWEFLYSPGQKRFLALSNITPLVRYLDLPAANPELAVGLPLNILVMLSSPPGYPALDLEGEWSRLVSALDDLQKRGLVTLTRLPDARLATLQKQLRQQDYHVFHFTGHGGFDAAKEDGVLLLEDEAGEARFVAGQALGTLLHDHRSLRLAVVNACQGTRSADDDPFAGVAQSLVHAGVPAVVAMQFEISDSAAATFGHEFYSAIADAYPVDAAVAEARKALANGDELLAWATPVLYMRSPEGVLWQMDERGKEKQAGGAAAGEHIEAGGDVIVNRPGEGSRGISASIGRNAQGVAVGKNIVQIGTLVVPTVPLVAILAVLLAGFALLGLRLAGAGEPRGPARMQGAFNVAVAEFGEVDGSGKVRPSPDGQRLSKWVYDSLQTQINGFSDPDVKTDVEVWHDSLPRTVQGTQIGLVTEDTAPAVAARIGAQMLVYGNLDAQHGFIPQFYISPQLHSDADATIGHYRLGDRPIPVDMSAPEWVKQNLTARTNSLFWLTIGLRQQNYGFSARALDVFRQAETVLLGWQGKEEGKEILYFLIGQAALFAGDEDTAQAALEQALNINPTYLRARVVLGSVYFRRAQALSPAEILETTDCEQAIAEYKKAEALASQSADRAWGEGAVPLALGMAYRLQGSAYQETGNLAQAGRLYSQAIEEMRSAIPPLEKTGETRLLGQALLALGTAYKWQATALCQGGDTAGSDAAYEQARSSYRQCIALEADSRFDTILTDRVIGQGCQPLLDQIAEASCRGED